MKELFDELKKVAKRHDVELQCLFDVRNNGAYLFKATYHEYVIEWRVDQIWLRFSVPARERMDYFKTLTEEYCIDLITSSAKYISQE